MWIALGLGLTACGAEEDIFRNLRFEDLSDRGVVLRFETTIATTCEAAVGTEPGEFTLRFEDPDMDPSEPYVFDHRVPLTGLDPETLYYVRAEAEDEGGTRYDSETLTFTTLERSPLVNFASLDEGARVAAVSSNWDAAPNDGPFGANLAIDGDFLTEWSTFTDGDDAFLEVDMGQVRPVGAVRIQSRQMTDGTSIVEKFRLIFDGSEIRGPFDTPDPDEVYAFPIEPPVDAQLVRMEAVETTGGNTGLQELQLFESMVP